MKKIWIIIIITVLILGAITGGIFLLLKNKPTPAPDIPDNPASQICQKISSAGDKNYCLAMVNRDINYCQKITGSDKNTCLAIFNKDSSFCDTIKDEAKKVCFNELARNSQDISFCAAAPDPENCYFNFINGLFWDGEQGQIKLEYCDKFSAQAPERQTCQALAKNDQTLCGQNPNCLAFFNQDLSSCQKLDKPDQSECIRNVALKTKNPAICAQIADVPAKNDCYLDYVGHIEADVTICDKISDKQIKTGCLKEAAEHLSDE